MSVDKPRLSPRKVTLIVVFLFAIVSVVSIAAVLERPMPFERTFDALQPVQYVTTKTISTSKDLQAVVKGSIYETGSNMTVFGACENGDGYLLPGSTANFTAWYPNGTIMLGPNATMDPILDGGNATGRYKIHVTMESTIGTYFTEMRCEYNNDYALAFGEWQNPEWVKKIGDTYQLSLEMNSTLMQMNVTLDELRALILQQNISEILDALSNLNSTLVAQRTVQWKIDPLNTQFNASGQGPSWASVDVLDSENVYVAGKNGSFATWNGYVWQYGGVVNHTWRGISGLDQALSYFWMVGRTGPYSPVVLQFTNDSQARYSVGGSTPQAIPNSTAGAYVDVKLFRPPNASLSQFDVLVLANDGTLWHSADQGATWDDFVQFHNVSALAGGDGRLSNVVWQGSDYEFAVVTQGGSFLYQNASSGIWQDTNVSRQYKDVSIRGDGTGYVVGVVGNDTVVWYFNKTSLAEVFSTTEGAPGGIAAPEGDVWMVLDNPAIYFNYNGTSLVRKVYPFYSTSSVIIGLDNAGSVFSGGDIGMSSRDVGYAVSGSGLIMKLEVQTTLQQMLTSIQLILLGGGVGGGMSQAQYEALISNITYVQDYLNVTVMASLEEVLLRVGLIDAKVNATLDITNRTEQKVDLLLNRTDRPRVWTTV